MSKHKDSTPNKKTPYQPTLYLKIDKDEACAFFEEFDKLTYKEKDIWRLALFYFKNNRVAFPLQTTIAKKAQVCRKHVNRTYAKFKRFGWLTLESRGKKRSKILRIPSYLAQMDLINRKYFKRVEVTSKVTHNYKAREIYNSGRTGERKYVKPSSYADSKGYSPTQCLKLGLIPEFYLTKAHEITSYKFERGLKLDSNHPNSYSTQTALRLAKADGVKINWRRYYYTLEHLKKSQSKRGLYPS